MIKQIYKNKITVTVSAVCLALSFGACKKYLGVEPVSSFGPEYVYGSVGNAQSAVLGAYACLGGDQGYGIRLSMYYTYDNDEMMGQEGAADNERRDIAHYNTQPSNTQLAGPFNQLYRGVERANQSIYNIPKMDLYNNGNATQQSQLRGLYAEALVLRAQFYFELIRNWGDLPAQFLPSSVDKDLFKAQTDRDTIYNRILNDLAEAAALLPWRKQAGYSNERITQGTARALRARIALFRGGYSLRTQTSIYGPVMARPADYKNYYQIAKDECAIIMQQSGDHNLNPSFQSVFKDALNKYIEEPNGEILWEVGMAGGSTNFGDSKLGYYNGPRYTGTASQGNSALTILPTYFYLFDSTDTRRDVTCTYYNINATLQLAARVMSDMVDGKFRRDWNPITTSAAQYFGVNWPVIRFSDVLLMFAEADNELNNNPTPAAIAAFEKVRTRGYGGDATKIGTTPAGYTAFFDAIVKERSLELGGEGIRKYDLIRWNKLGEKLNLVKTQLAAIVANQAPYDQLPKNMYYLPNQSVSTGMVWGNSFYKPTPAAVPAGYSTLAWLGGSGITNKIIGSFARSFEPNMKELLPFPQSATDANPNLKQNRFRP
jgi:hypothetical protein